MDTRIQALSLCLLPSDLASLNPKRVYFNGEEKEPDTLQKRPHRGNNRISYGNEERERERETYSQERSRK